MALEKDSKWVITTASPDETKRVGRHLGAVLQPGMVLGLIGDLGAGKTCFVKGLAQGIGVAAREVTSPTFVLLHRYEGRTPLYHFDCYRLEKANEIFELGFYEFLEDGVVVVEWFEKIDMPISAPLLVVEIQIVRANKRQLMFVPHCEKTVEILNKASKFLISNQL